MDKTYIKLFRDLAHTTENLAEQVMTLNKESESIKSAKIMRDDYAKLYDKIRDGNFSPDTLTRGEFARLLVGAIIVAQQIENRIEKEKTALQGYKIDIIPKLERIVNETNTDEEALSLATEVFNIKVENE